MRNKSSHTTGIPTGFSSFDRLTSGLQPSDLTIVAARPGMGKTSFVLSLAQHVAIVEKRPVAFFSLEMSNIQLMQRLASLATGIANDRIMKGKLEDYEWNKLLEKIQEMSNAPIYMDDTPSLSVFDLRAKCRRLKMQHNIELVIIDYLQLMTGNNQEIRQGNREQEVSHISRSLKTLAKELNLPVIALSQLSRAVEHRGGAKRPQLADLRESGSLEQDADLVAFIYRPEYYGIIEDEDGNSLEGIAEVIIAKNRHGETTDFQLHFQANCAKFSDLQAHPVISKTVEQDLFIPF